MMSNRPRKQSFSRSRRSVEQHALRLRNPQTFENLWMLNWKLYDLLDLLDLLF